MRLLIGTWTFIAPTDGGPRKMLVSALLNIPLVIALLLLFLRRLRNHTLTSQQLALSLLLLYVVEAFAFFVSWGSYFTMLLPLALLLAVSLIRKNHKDSKTQRRARKFFKAH
jgi:heme exporter protein D